MKTITIYTLPTCNHCHDLKEYLDSKDIPYTDIDVLEDNAAQAKAIDLSGDTAVPIVHIQNGEERVIVGFDQQLIDEALAAEE